MKRKTVKYTHEPMDGVLVSGDFLPPPGQLVFKDDQIKVTLTLSKRSVDFFKHHAEERDVGYQTMIRALLDQYAHHFSSRSK